MKCFSKEAEGNGGVGFEGEVFVLMSLSHFTSLAVKKRERRRAEERDGRRVKDGMRGGRE